MRSAILFTTTVILVALVVLMPLGIALGQEASSGRVLPDAVHNGETFDVTVTFTAPVDKFNAVGLTDLCPDGWDVTVDEAWCSPKADAVLATGDKAEIAWYGEPDVGFAKDISFTALYKVTVPDDAELGIHAFDGFLEYYAGAEGPFVENITGSSQVEVVGGGGGIGVWWIVGIVVGIAVIVAAALLVRRRRA